ncbi:hypothetical protein L873DRAFT_1847396 [Choiromyces venosus 120613-1]|uniref:Kelch repeat protein n=1 Tax=Choiromyces venosus 120613-1 TaxID=1336337 RepID=A0A3N4J6Y3_9PEZI|nr:hypothetical protein L873DRAFT_1847396 [Choiromyces venosus 120613-1]
MPLFRSGVWLLGALLSFASVAHGVDADPTDDFCSLSGHMSGLPLNSPKSKRIVAQKDDTVLRSLNVSKSFQTSLDSVNYVKTEAVPDTIPGVQDAVFFPTASGFDLTFGRWWPYNSTIFGKKDGPIEDKKWQYEIATQQWTNTEITLSNWFQANSPMRVSSSMTAWIPSLKKGFLFGGVYVSENGTSLKVTEFEEHNGLITYDQATNTWTNQTTSLGGIAEGGLVQITTATDEVLIQFGGRSDWATRMRPFTEINIYSTNQSKWYTQHLPPDATVPTPRFAFCTAIKSASDGSSHQIYILGGLEASSSVNVKGGPTTTSIWVLSIPSFEWTQLAFKSKSTTADPKGRISPKCQAIGEHYIFYYGGRNVPSYFTIPTCDKKANAAFLFDINTLTWTDQFTPNEGTYEIPQGVIDLIGGDSKTGGSTKKAPAKGWSDPDLASIMALKSTTSGSSGPGTNNSSNGTGTASGSGSDPSKPNVGAIAGGTVAGVAAVALGFLSAMLLRRHRQKKKSHLSPNPIKPPPTYAGALEDGGSPTELMAHNYHNGSGYTAELPAGEVAREMYTGNGNGRGK